MADFDILSAMAGAAQGQIPSYGDVSPYAGMAAPTDPFSFQLGISGPNWGSLSGPMATASMFMGLMGIQNPTASLGFIGGPARYSPGNVIAGRQYAHLSKQLSLFRAGDTQDRAAFMADFAKLETGLVGETTSVRSDFATMMEDPASFGGKEAVVAERKRFNDKLAAIEAAEADPSNRFDRSELARKRTELVQETSQLVSGMFDRAGKKSELYANRVGERAESLARQLQENPELAGVISMAARELGVEGELDKLAIYRKAVTQSGALQLGYGGGGKASVDIFGPDIEKVKDFAQKLDKERETRNFATQGITSSKIGEVMSSMSARGLGGVDDPKKAVEVANIAETMKALEAVFGPGAPVEEIMRSLERMANSSIAGMSQSKIRAWGQKVQAVADTANMSTQDLVRAVEGGAQDAIRRGMSGEIGATSALAGFAVASSLREQQDRGGAGALTEAQGQNMVYQAGMEVSQSRMGRTIGNIFALAVTRAQQKTGMSRKDVEALSMQDLVSKAGLSGKAAEILLDSVTAKGGTAEFLNQFLANNDGAMQRGLAESFGMTDAEANAARFSEVNASGDVGIAKALGAGFIQMGNVREKFLNQISAGFSVIRGATGGRSGDTARISALFDAAARGNAEFNVKDFTAAEVDVLQDSARRLNYGSVESMLAISQGAKNAALAEKAVSFNAELTRKGYGQKTTSQAIWNLITGGDGSGGQRRSFTEAMSEAAGAISIRDTAEALTKAGFDEKEKAEILKGLSNDKWSEDMLVAASSDDPAKRDKALKVLENVRLEGAKETAAKERESGEKLVQTLDKLEKAISKESGEAGAQKVVVEFSGEAAEIFKVKEVVKEPAEKAAQAATK